MKRGKEETGEALLLILSSCESTTQFVGYSPSPVSIVNLIHRGDKEKSLGNQQLVLDQERNNITIEENNLTIDLVNECLVHERLPWLTSIYRY